MNYRYDVDLVAYDNETQMLISIKGEGDSTAAAIKDAIESAQKLLKEDVVIEVNGYKPLDE